MFTIRSTGHLIYILKESTKGGKVWRVGILFSTLSVKKKERKVLWNGHVINTVALLIFSPFHVDQQCCVLLLSFPCNLGCSFVLISSLHASTLWSVHRSLDQALWQWSLSFFCQEARSFASTGSDEIDRFLLQTLMCRKVRLCFFVQALHLFSLATLSFHSFNCGASTPTLSLTSLSSWLVLFRSNALGLGGSPFCFCQCLGSDLFFSWFLDSEWCCILGHW